MWLLEEKIKKIIENAEDAGIIPTAEQQINFDAINNDEGDLSILYKTGSSAEISIKGVLTKAPSFLSMLFGGGNTTYSSIVSAVENAEHDDNVKTIVLDIDSPGGQFDGMFSAIEAIQAVKKPIKAVVSGAATSAAFALASQADEIVGDRTARFGSVGVVATIRVLDDEVTITSTNAPKKAPDVTTKEGIQVVKDQLDDLHAVFVEAIATGRKTTVKDVNANFGRGSVLLAGEALKRGMIDTISGPSLKLVDIEAVNKPEVTNMDLKEFKSQHTEVYSEAIEVGVKQELDRVTAHLIMGEQSGDMKTAIEAISNGSEMTCTLQAKYMAAGMNKSDVEARQTDDVATNKATDNLITEANEPGNKESELVGDIVVAKLSSGIHEK